ncbi:hypothetical protein N7457_002930 [Penicillium paradoxum]|uniref:uncharacterized protein n=1 Tax=Penicillium paradoxum TaxID=176176 RepID=UPI0025484CA3|nr:uncharacterized protein N7457_002930 [Penicillium paradoxum]KAJ5787940.1 hypothetical protein N7457_002930 [Penicillium paradoxum]
MEKAMADGKAGKSSFNFNPEAAEFLSRGPMDPGSQTSSNGHRDSALSGCDFYSPNHFINPIDAIGLNPNRVNNLLSDPDFVADSSSQSSQNTLIQTPRADQHVTVEKIMRGVDYIGEQNGYFILRKHPNEYHGGNNGIVAYDARHHRMVALAVNDSALNDGDILVVASWEAGSGVITGHANGNLLVWDIDSGSSNFVRRLVGLHEAVTCILMVDNIVVAGGAGGSICVWNLKTSFLIPVRTLKGHTGAILCMKVKECCLVSGSADKDARFWDIFSGHCIQVLRGHRSEVRFVCIDSIGIMTASSNMVQGSGSDIKVWRFGTHEFAAGNASIPERQMPGPQFLSQLQLYDDCLVAGGLGELHKYDFAQGGLSIFTDNRRRPIVALDAKGPITIIGTGDGSVDLIDQRICAKGESWTLGTADKIWTVKIVDNFKLTAVCEKDRWVTKSTWCL